LRTGDTVLGEIDAISAGAATTVMLTVDPTLELTVTVAVSDPADTNLAVLQLSSLSVD